MFSLAPFSLSVTGYWIVRVPFPLLLNFNPPTTTVYFFFSSSLSFVIGFLFRQLNVSGAHIDYSTSNAINTPNQMRRYYTVSGILLILPIIDFALAAPVLVQEKRQADVDVAHIPEDAITMLGKRGDELNELWLKALNLNEGHLAKPEESSAARPSSSSPPSGSADGWRDLTQPLPSIPGEPSPVSSHELMGAHPLPNPPRPSTPSDHEMVDVPPSSGSASTKETDEEMVDVSRLSPPPGSARPIEPDHEMADVQPSIPESSTNPGGPSTGAGYSSGTPPKTYFRPHKSTIF
jgi:hypothetical protein